MIKYLKGAFAALGVFCLFLAATAPVSAQYVGANPATGLSGTALLPYAIGTPPAVTGCNTGSPVIVGGASRGRITTVGTTSCTLVMTYVVPALGVGATAPSINGAFCIVIDLTTVATLFTESATAYVAPTLTAAGSLSCTFSVKTITSGDVLLYDNSVF